MTDNGLTSYTTIELSRYNEQIPLKNIHLIPELNTEVRDSKLSDQHNVRSVSYTHLRAHETDSYLVCRLLLEKKKEK